MKQFQVANRYSGSFFELADQEGRGEELADELSAIAHSFREQPEFFDLLQNPLVKHQDKYEAIRKVWSWQVHPLTEQFLRVLVDRKRMDVFPLIAKHVHDLVQKKKGVEEATVVSACALDSEVLDTLRKALEQITRKKIKVALKVNAELLGGLQIRVGNHLLDDSVKTRLESLRARLRTMNV